MISMFPFSFFKHPSPFWVTYLLGTNGAPPYVGGAAAAHGVDALEAAAADTEAQDTEIIT